MFRSTRQTMLWIIFVSVTLTYTMPAVATLGDPTDATPLPAGYQKIDTLHMATFNTFLLPSINGSSANDGECRGQEWALELANEPYEIIALQEVFDDHFADPIRGLSPGFYTGIFGYPRWCSMAYADGAPEHATCRSWHGGLAFVTRNQGNNYPHLVKQIYFRDDMQNAWTNQSGRLLTDADRFVYKGFMHIKILKAGRYWMHFIVTHTNAGSNDSSCCNDFCVEGREKVEARLRDMAVIFDYIKNSGEIPTGEPVFIMGDLNIDDTDTFDNNPEAPREWWNTGQRDRMFTEFSNRFPQGELISVFARYRGRANDTHLTYDRANNYFGLDNPDGEDGETTIDWDDMDRNARFDWIAYFTNGTSLLFAPLLATDVRIDRAAPLGAVCAEGFTNLSDHFGIAAKLDIYENNVPPPPPQAAPAPPDFIAPNESADGRGGVVSSFLQGRSYNYDGRFSITARTASRIGGPYPGGYNGGPPDLVRIYEQYPDQAGPWTLWYDTGRFWDVTLTEPEQDRYGHSVTVDVLFNISTSVRRVRYYARAMRDGQWSAPSPYTLPIDVEYLAEPSGHTTDNTAKVFGAGTNDVMVAVSWSAPQNSAPAWYQLFTADGGNQLIWEGPDKSAFVESLCAGPHRYFVRACDYDVERGAYNCGPRSTVEIIADVEERAGAPACVGAFVTPSLIDAEGRVYLRWVPTDGADEYQIEQARSRDFSDAQLVWAGSQTEAILSVNLNSGEYFYRLRACKQGTCHWGYRSSYNAVTSQLQ